MNNAYFAKEFMKLAVYGVYSDFLSPAQVNNSYIRANCPKFAPLKAKIKALEGENEQLSDRLGKAILEKERNGTP